MRLKATRASRQLVEGGKARVEDSPRAYRDAHRGAEVEVLKVNRKTANMRFASDRSYGFWRYSLDLLTAVD